MMDPLEIPENSYNIPPGWPRPYYRVVDEQGRARRKPVQYITDHAASQIFACSDPKLEQTERLFACTCCGHLLIRGTLIDVETLRAKGTWYREDTNYGGAMCYRCTVFAFAVCPEFKKWHATEGEGFPLLDVKTARQYYRDPREGGSGAVHRSGTFARKTTLAWVREQVRAGNLEIKDETVENLSPGS